MISSARFAFRVAKPTVSKFLTSNNFSQIRSIQTVVSNTQRNFFSNSFTTRSLVNNNNNFTVTLSKPGVIYLKNHFATVADTNDGKLSSEELDKLFESQKEYYHNNFLKVNLELLEDFPKWLETLGLSACVPLFQGVKWRDAINMDYKALKERGVESFFIRSRLLRHFDMVKCKIAGKEQDPNSAEWKEPEGTDEIPPYDVKMCDDLPSFLHSLGGSLGIFAAYFHGKTWKEIIRMSESEIKNAGIKGKSVRRSLKKRLRSFKKFAVEKGLIEDFPDPDPPAPESRENLKEAFSI